MKSTIAVLLAICTLPARAADPGQLVKQLSDSNESVRRAAWEGAANQGAPAISPLCTLAAGENREAALAAVRAIDCIAHASAAPGSSARKDVGAALAATLGDAKLPASLKLHVLELLGSVGESNVVPEIAKALADSELGDFARKALERLPGEASEKALEAALAGASAERRDAIIGTLGSKQAKDAVPGLIRIASEEGGSRLAAARALARIGDPRGVPAIEAALKTAPKRGASLLADDLLRMADGLRASGDGGAARSIYSGMLSNPDAARRYAALFALYGGAGEKDTGALVAALDDASPRVRGLGLELLTKFEGTQVNELLLARYEAVKGAQRAPYLRALKARSAPGIEKLLEAAAGDPDVDLKWTALELAGKTGSASSETLALEAMEKGSPAVKDAAVKACLDIADARAANDAAGAANLYRRAFESSGNAQDRGRALIGLGKSGNKESLAKIQAARSDASLSRSASQALVLYATAIGRAGSKDEAIELLQSVLGSGAPRESVQAAIVSLKELGGDPGVLQKKQGLLVAWRIVGPFPNKDGKGFAAVYSPEEEVRLDGTQKDERGRNRKWQDFVATSIDGKVDLRQVFQRSSDVCAYAYAEITVPEARDVRFKIGSDDGFICWLNGKKLGSVDTVRAWAPDQDSVDARLEAGANKVLLKILQGGGEWEFSFRVTDRKDQPVDLTSPKK